MAGTRPCGLRKPVHFSGYCAPDHGTTESPSGPRWGDDLLSQDAEALSGRGEEGSGEDRIRPPAAGGPLALRETRDPLATIATSGNVYSGFAVACAATPVSLRLFLMHGFHHFLSPSPRRIRRSHHVHHGRLAGAAGGGRDSDIRIGEGCHAAPADFQYSVADSENLGRGTG